MISNYLSREFPPCGRAATLLVLAIASFGIAFGAAVALMACAPASL
jgi:hypothetical protein